MTGGIGLIGLIWEYEFVVCFWGRVGLGLPGGRMKACF